MKPTKFCGFAVASPYSFPWISSGFCDLKTAKFSWFHLAEFPLQEAVRGKDVEVEWMPFELRPEPHPTLRPEGDYLQRAWSQSVYPIARRMGVPINLPPVSPQPHTHLAFEGFQYAKEHGKGNEYNHRVSQAFFVEGQDIGQTDVLTKLAGEVGLDEKEFEEALRTRKYREAHRRALRHAYEEAVIEEELKAQGNAAQPG
jgi:predicted DsbA family dithiol-disulfide isomerase